jgi:hypothetical protein
MLLAWGLSGSPISSAGTRSLLVPNSGVLFGSWVDEDGAWTNNADAEREVRTFESQIGRRLDIDHHYYAWTDRFPSGLEQWDVANGRIPLITWKGTDLSEILSGRDDAMIAARARAVRALHVPVFLRWGWEMNGSWSTWGGALNGGAGVGPARYIAAWRHIHDIFVRHGTDNVAWVWAPNDGDVPDESWNHWTHYYPGDAYVDWVGIDGFNWGTSTSWGSWRDLSDLISELYSDYAGRKPIMISETGSARSGGSKAEWFNNARQALETQFPDVRAFVYFSAPDHQYPSDWRATTSATSGSAFKAWAHDPYFEGGSTAPIPAVAGVFVWPSPFHTKGRIAFTLGGKADVSIEIRDGQGVPVRHVQTLAPWPSGGSFAVKWNGLDDLGDPVLPGWYTAVVEASTDPNAAPVRANCTFQVK